MRRIARRRWLSMIMSALVLSACAGFGLAGSHAAEKGDSGAESIRVGSNVKMIVGEQGAKVAMVKILPADSKKYLLYFTGTDQDIDGKVLLHEQVSRDGGQVLEYTTKIRGKDFWTVREDVNRFTGTVNYVQIQIPGVLRPQPAYSRHHQSGDITPEQIREKYLTQKK